MKRKSAFPMRVMAVVFLGVGLSTPAWAYVDPGAGNMLVQLMMGGVGGILILIKLYWRSLKRFILSRFIPENKKIKAKLDGI